MTSALRSLRNLAVAAITVAASPAFAGELQPLGDTVLESLGRDEVAATSDTYQPGVRHDGPSTRVAFDTADPELVGPPALELATTVSFDDATTGTFTLTFDGQTTSASHFDGRFLTARDLTREQGYRMEAAGPSGLAFGYDLYRGGVRVASVDVDDGVAPFVLEGVDRLESVHTAAARPRPGGGQEIELHSWSLGTWTATFDSGAALTVDHVVVHHELGHALGFRHEHVTVRAAGALELRVGGEDLIVADAAPITARVNDTGAGGATIDMWTTGVGNVDVHSVFLPAYTYTLDPRPTTFTPPSGYRIRLRSRRDGAAFGAWSAWSTSAKLLTPPPAADTAIDDFEVEIQRPGTAAIATSGYIRVKKLNSGG